MDFEAAGLLDGLDGEERTERLRLLEQLAGEGFSIERLKAAAAEDRLALLQVERLLAGRYSARQIEQRTGLPLAWMLRLRRMLGLPEAGPDECVFGEEALAAAASTKLYLGAGLDEDAIAEITRVLGEGMARLAATTVAAFADAFLEAGDSERELAERFAALARELVPALDPVLIGAYKQHLAESVRRGMVSRAERASGQIGATQEMTVCFADVAGFTRLGLDAEPDQLGLVAVKLAELATEVAEPPVRLVKTIGDAAMFVGPDPAAMVAVALSLLAAAQAADLPSLRAGIACGPALQRAGDFYGHAVNLASRVTGTARPDSVLCTEQIRDAAPARFAWSFAGAHRLKGMGEALPLYRARARDGADRDSGPPQRRAEQRGSGSRARRKADR